MPKREVGITSQKFISEMEKGGINDAGIVGLSEIEFKKMIKNSKMRDYPHP